MLKEEISAAMLQLLGYVTGLVNQELLLRKATLAQIAKPLGRKGPRGYRWCG